MFTVCPKCTLTLAVTANDLRVGQGYVRCGRCSNVFNALLKLTDAPAEGVMSADLPELGEADPASTSQIHRAITAAAIDVNAPAAAATAAAAARPAARPGAAAVQRPAASPAAPAPALTPAPAPKPASASPAAPAAAPTPPRQPVTTAPGSAPGAARAAATSTPAGAAAIADPAATPRRRSTDAAPDPRGSSSPAPAAPMTTQEPARKSPPPAPRPAAPAAPADPTSMAPRQPAFAPRPPGGAATAAGSPARAAPRPTASASDGDAIDQFELVLQTLGLNADGDEPPLQQRSPLPEGPTQTVENIVLEGDEITQSEALVPDKPLDELDLFTRRLGIATSTSAPGNPTAARPSDAAAAAESTAAPTAASVQGAGAQPAGRLAARRASLAQTSRRDFEGAGGGDAATAAARAAGRETGIAANPTALEAADGAGVLAAPDLDIPGLRAATPLQQRVWIAGAALLAVLLLAQLVNHWREALAASPTWGHSVTELYGALGVPLQPQWDLSAYEVRQQGAESESGTHEAIRVRFSLANHATRAQPVPTLRLTLLDRYGRRVAERDLTPADYWPKGRSPQSFLGADERVDTEVQVRDPSADSASFELDVCLPEAQGAIRCAGDAAAAAAASATP